jgi:hypothetical protein
MGNDQSPRQVWPTCPNCDRPRTAVCPVCGTSGNDFRLGWGDTTAGTVELNAATEDLAADDEAAEVLVICPGCDESFLPGFLVRCEWCGYRFRSGVEHEPEEPEPWEPLNLRVIGTMAVIVVAAAAMLGYFAMILR